MDTIKKIFLLFANNVAWVICVYFGLLGILEGRPIVGLVLIVVGVFILLPGIRCEND